MMFNFENIEGIDLSTELCGIKLKSPFILSSGPLSYAAEGLIKAYKAGAGAVVTKTLRESAAINPVPHIGIINDDSLINCEKWADTEAELWFKREIPMAKEAGAIVIASVGHTLREAEALVEDCEKAGADFIELVSYTEDEILPMLKITKSKVNIPVICKLSGNWPDPVATAEKCREQGADAISAIDSIGPTLKIDIKKARPAMYSNDGYGWLSGAAIRPIAMRIVSEIARNGCQDLVGIGGVKCAENVIEYLMVGSGAVGVCSTAIIRGVEVFSELCYKTAILLKQLGYNSIKEVKGVALANFPEKETIGKLDFYYQANYAPCQKACPANVDIPLYIDKVKNGDYIGAYETMSESVPFPGVLGRVCDYPCELQCRRSIIDDPIQIRLIKRFAADKTFANCGNNLPLPEMQKEKGEKIAIIGAGPAGLSSAYFLAQKGYKVKVFESLPVAGGMLAVGIPDYRLPKEIFNKELSRLNNMGIEIRTGVEVGKDITIDEIKKQGYAKIIIATGAHGEPDLKLPGQELEGVISGLRFLKDLNLNLISGLYSKKVAVIGGGNVAIDAARSALRLGAQDVTIVYRRNKNDMPAYKEEIEAAEEEGVKFKFLASPVEFTGNKKLEEFYYQAMKPGEIDETGRRKPVPTDERPISMEVDIVILAVGQKIITDFIPEIVDKEKGITVEKDIYLAGDCVSGPESIIKAIASGKELANIIDNELNKDEEVNFKIVKEERLGFPASNSMYLKKEEAEFIPVQERIPGFNEVEKGLSENSVRKETLRCLQCGCINCNRCVDVCPYDARSLEFPVMKVNEDLCRNCGLCVSVCPTGALTAEIIEQAEKIQN
jgi:NADPH-dependent glutamate synthase beta subunit-like oxidoreductase/dihydroorotate dehydrogenase/ferredoxin